MFSFLLAAFIALLLFVGFHAYTLMQNQRDADKSWTHIDVRMKMRHSELQKLMAVCHQQQNLLEERTLKGVENARNHLASAMETGNFQSLGEAETYLRDELKRIYEVAAANPELGSNETISRLLNGIAKLQAAIVEYSERYNAQADRNNTRLETFPGNLLGSLFGYSHLQPLTFKTEDRKNIGARSF